MEKFLEFILSGKWSVVSDVKISFGPFSILKVRQVWEEVVDTRRKYKVNVFKKNLVCNNAQAPSVQICFAAYHMT